MQKLLTYALFAVAALVNARATTYYVSTTGSDSSPGSSTQPFRTITYAYGKTAAGDTVLVMPGTYTDYTSGWGLHLNHSGSASSPITLKSQTRGAAIIDGLYATGRGVAFYIDGSYNTVDGFEICHAPNGGFNVYGSGTRILNCNIHDNGNVSGTSGTGIFSDSNTSGGYYAGNLIHHHGTVANQDHGLYLCGKNESLINNVIYANFATGVQIAGYQTVANLKVYNNVIAFNGTDGIILWQSLSGIDIKNNLFYQNGTWGIGSYQASGSGVSIDHNLSYGNKTGDFDLSGFSYTLGTTLKANPLFVSASASSLDAHLSAGSPAIGAGLNLSSTFTTDLAGTPRPSSGAWDLGAYVCAAASTPPVVTLTAPSSGATYTAPASINLAASVTANGHTITSVQFYNGSTLLGTDSASPYTFGWSNVSASSYSLTARVAYDAGSTVTSAPVPVTVAQAPAPVVTLTSPASGATYTAPASLNLAASVTANGHTITSVQFYSGSTLLGTDSASPYTFSWTNVSAGSSSLTARVVYDAGSTLTSAPVSVTVTAPSTPPPVSSTNLTFASTSGAISAPFYVTNGAICQPASTSVTNGGQALYNFTVPTAGNYVVSALVSVPSTDYNSFFVNIDAQPTDPTMIWDIPVAAGWVSQTVSWRGNGTVSATSSSGLTAQFAPKVFNLAAGTHQFIIRGREANCQLASITLAPYGTTPNPPPVIALTAPVSGASYTAPATISLAASVTANGHTITSVQFFSGSTLLGTASAAPYTFSWNNASAGTYALSAQAVYDGGSAVTSAPLTVAVATPPVVTLTSPASGASYTAPAAISLAASVTANGHTISSVQFYNGTTLLGTDTAAPYIFSWNNASAGTYALSAQAVYDAGSVVASPAASVTVMPAAPPPTNQTFAATSGTLTSPFFVTNGAICQPANTASPSTGGQATYTVTVPSSGDYLVSALVSAPSTDYNSFFVNMDAQPTDPTMIWDIPVTTGFASQTVSWRGNGTVSATSPSGLTAQFAPKVFNLAAGTHQLIIRGREANCQLASITLAPATILPAPWQALDIGNVGVTGGSTVTNGVYTVAGAGSLSGTADAFRFLYQPLSGDGEIRAQVSSLPNNGAKGSIGVMVRESLTSGSRYALMGVSPAGTFQRQSRTSTGSSSVSATAGAGTAPNLWVRLVRAGDAFSSYTSTDGVNWSNVNTSTNVMAANIYLGLAVASGTTNTLSSTLGNVTVVP